jgi:hypothetical protein
MPDSRLYRYLNALMAKAEFAEQDFHEFFAPEVSVTTYQVSPEHNIEGVLYIKEFRGKQATVVHPCRYGRRFTS